MVLDFTYWVSLRFARKFEKFEIGRPNPVWLPFKTVVLFQLLDPGFKYQVSLETTSIGELCALVF